MQHPRFPHRLSVDCCPVMLVPRRIEPVLCALLLGSAVLGCDQVSPVGADSEGTPPTVSDLGVRPDSIHVSDLPPDQVEDSLAQLGIALDANVEDPDGTVERVNFTIEPASNPGASATGQLQHVDSTRYGRVLALQVPSFRDEVYTVRVFAVDNDSLASNQGVGQIQFVADQ